MTQHMLKSFLINAKAVNVLLNHAIQLIMAGVIQFGQEIYQELPELCLQIKCSESF